jgi:hypothetical protein
MDRVNTVTVLVGTLTVKIHWDERETLLGHLRRSRRATRIVGAFEGGGTSRPIVVGEDDLGVLLEVVNDLWHELGTDRLPPELHELRGALLEALHA